MEIALICLAGVAVVSVIALAFCVYCLTKKVAERDTEFVGNLVDNCQTTAFSSYNRGLVDGDEARAERGFGLGSPVVQPKPEDAWPQPDDDPVEEITEL